MIYTFAPRAPIGLTLTNSAALIILFATYFFPHTSYWSFHAVTSWFSICLRSEQYKLFVQLSHHGDATVGKKEEE